MVFFRSFVLLVLCLSLASCASIRLHGETGKSVEASASAYRQKRLEQGVVLLDVRWGRQWPCGQYQNAQLISFTFDKIEPTRLSRRLQLLRGWSDEDISEIFP